MVRGLLPTVLVLAFAATAPAAEPLRFRWQAGQVLTYSAEQITTVLETTVDEGKPVTAATVTRVAMTRRWTVKAVEPDGSATVEMTITAMKRMIARPGPKDKDGNPTIDRTIVDSATTDGRQQMADFLDRPLVVAKVDPRGRVMEVITGSADRLRAEPPFRLELPEGDPGGASWARTFGLKLTPPLGTGEAYEARQTFTPRGETTGTITVGLATTLTAPPADPAELIALVPSLWEGEAAFHRATGRYSGSKLTARREVANHQGEGSRFVYESQFTETLIER